MLGHDPECAECAQALTACSEAAVHDRGTRACILSVILTGCCIEQCQQHHLSTQEMTMLELQLKAVALAAQARQSPQVQCEELSA